MLKSFQLNLINGTLLKSVDLKSSGHRKLHLYTQAHSIPFLFSFIIVWSFENFNYKFIKIIKKNLKILLISIRLVYV